MPQLVVLVVSTLANLALGSLVYLQDLRSATNRLFLLLTSSFAEWSVANYLSVHAIGVSQLWWIRIVLFFAALLSLAVFLTFDTFPEHRLPSRPWRKWAVLAAVFTMLLTLTPLVFKGLKIDQEGAAHPVPAFGIGLFAVVVGALLCTSIYTIVKKFRVAEGRTKVQLRFILIGLAGTFGLIFITNFLLVLAGNNRLVPFGPAYTLIFSACFAYAAIRHKLFDIRFFVVRAMAYALTLLLVIAAYIIPTVLIVAWAYGVHLNLSNLIAGVCVSLVLALCYPYIIRLFNALTSKIFFRSIYDPQAILDKLGDMLVRTIDAKAIQRDSVSILQEALRAESLEYLLLTDDNQRILHAVAKVAAKSSKDNLLIIDEWEGNTDLVAPLREERIAAVVQLRTAHEDLGFILVGYKRSGQPFNASDKYLLRIAADTVALSLQNALRFEQIQNFNRLLREKVDEATRELRHSNAKLRAMDETKDDFISMASHQLRTPLTSVKGYLSMVLEGDAGNITPLQKQMLGQAYISSQRMVYLIADLLNVSRLKTGKFVIEARPVNLSTMIEEEVKQLVETAKSRDLTLSYKKPSDFPELMLDETKTRQVIMNFIDNAIYYTPAGGRITVELLNKPSTVEVHVIDDGIGVPKSEQHHLFTKFYRAQNARRARPDGTGLGLFMAKKVVAAQGGAIIFESQEGKGSSFGFTFSKSKLALTESKKAAPALTA